MRKKSTIQIMFNLQEYQDLHTIMTFYFKGVEQNRRDCAKQLIIPINPAWETSCLRWNDTKPARKNGSQLIVILNDQNNIAKGVEDAFLNYDAKVIKWSERDSTNNLELLSAS